MNVLDFGAKGDGVTDDTDAVAAAINQANGAPVFFPAGKYVVTRTLPIRVWKYRLVGDKSERGANGYGASNGYANSIIVYRPTRQSDALVSRYDPTPPFGGVIGPFEHENILFDLAAANGFCFGSREIEPVVTDGNSQKYVFGVSFRSCGFQGVSGPQDGKGGRIRRSERKFISLTKAFETVVENVSFAGGDTHVFTWGCDKPTFRDVRSQGAFCAFDLNASGTFTQQYVIDGLEVEGWSTAAVRNNGVKLAISNASFECGPSFSNGRCDLTANYGCTAKVTAGDDTVICSMEMEEILFPGYSVVAVKDGERQFTAVVRKIEGRRVTFDTSALRVTWSSERATLVRLHGCCVMHLPGPFNTQLVNIEAGPAPQIPAFVYCMSQGIMSLTNVNAVAGTFGDIRSILIGNLVGGPYADGQMVFTGCSPLVMADPAHPWVYSENFTDTHGARLGNQPGGDRMPGGGQYLTERLVMRKWLFAPRLNGTAINHYNQATVESIQGDPDTLQSYWAWRVDEFSGYALGVHDETFPSQTEGELHLRFRARTVTGAATVHVAAHGNGGQEIAHFAVDSVLRSYDFKFPIPPAWRGTRSSPSLLVFSTQRQPFYLVDGILFDQSAEERQSSPRPISSEGRKAGTFELRGNSVVVENQAVTADSVVVVTVRNPGRAHSQNPDIVLLPGKGFIASAPGAAPDDSSYNYIILEVR